MKPLIKEFSDPLEFNRPKFYDITKNLLLILSTYTHETRNARIQWDHKYNKCFQVNVLAGLFYINRINFDKIATYSYTACIKHSNPCVWLLFDREKNHKINKNRTVRCIWWESIKKKSGKQGCHSVENISSNRTRCSFDLAYSEMPSSVEKH